MPVVLNFIERLVVLGLNQGPAPMLDFFGALAFRAFCAGVRLGVFDVLRSGPLTAAEVARRIEADERGTTLLLQALEALGYVKERQGRYANTAMTTRWLPILAEGVAHFESEVGQWVHLEDSIRAGKPTVNWYERLAQEPQRWPEYQAGMLAVARITADEIAAKVKLPPSARRLLDVGGGHGFHSIRICRRYPRLSATVFDLPQALAAARRLIAAEEVGDRVSVQEGDYWEDDLGEDYDAALVFNVLLEHSPGQNTELLRRVARALNPGGVVVILDLLRGRLMGSAARAVASLEGLSVFVGTGGQAYAFDDVAGWLRVAGFARPRRIGLLRSPGLGLAVATKVN